MKRLYVLAFITILGTTLSCKSDKATAEKSKAKVSEQITVLTDENYGLAESQFIFKTYIKYLNS